jgi:hypothetical protein
MDSPSKPLSRQEPHMNAISISIFAIVITAALALVTPAVHFVQHERMTAAAHATSVR